MDVVKKLEALRDQKKWTNYRIAKESGLSQSTIENIYRRRSKPQIETLEVLCKTFGISLAQFFAEDEKMAFLTDTQIEIVSLFEQLNDREKRAITAIMKLLTEE